MGSVLSNLTESPVKSNKNESTRLSSGGAINCIIKSHKYFKVKMS